MAWNKPSEEKKVEGKGRARQRNVHLKGLVAGAIVVLGAAIAAWVVLSGSDDAPARGTRHAAHSAAIREVTPAAAPKAAAAPDAALPAADAHADVKAETHEQAFSNKLARALEKARKMGEMQIFKNPSDQLLAMAVDDRDMPPIPVGPVSQKDFLESLKTPLEIGEGDSEEIRVLKERVMAARAEMKELIDSGRTYYDVLKELQERKKEDSSTWMKCQDELREIWNSGDRDGAKVYCQAMNIELEKMGIKPLRMPMTKEEARAYKIERARTKRMLRQQQQQEPSAK